MPHPAHQDVAGGEIRVLDAPRAGGDDDLVEVAVDRRQRGATVGCRLVEGAQHRRARAQLTDQRRGQHVRPQRPLVRRPQGHESLHAAVAALLLHVVPGDQPTEAVPDHVDAVVARLLAEPLDVPTEVLGALGDVGQPWAVVPGADRREAPAAQAAPHHGEDRPVVDEAVHEQHGDARGERVGGEQRADGGRLVSGPVAAVGADLLGARAQRVEQCMGAQPGQLGEPAGQRLGAHEGAQASSWRPAGEGGRVRRWTGARGARRAHRQPLSSGARRGPSRLPPQQVRLGVLR